MSKIVNIKIQTEKEQTLVALTEALDALEDASEVIADVL